MTDADDHAQMAVDATFDMWGKPAVYHAPEFANGALGGAGRPCTIMRDQADRDLRFGKGRQHASGNIVEVRRAEIEPVREGVFVLNDGTRLKVMSDPKVGEDDIERLVYRVTVS